MPWGRMSLQIFEQRYLDLVARCMREASGFGVVAEAGLRGIRWRHRHAQYHYGTYARIVDWDQAQRSTGHCDRRARAIRRAVGVA